MTNNKPFPTEAASALNLHITEVTGGANGYPEPHLGYAVHGFDTYQEAEDFAKEHGGRVSEFFKQNGWQLCNVRGGAYDAYTAGDYAEKLGDEYAMTTEDDLLDQTTDWCKRFDGDLSDFLLRAKRVERIIEELEKANEDETVITYAGEYFETVENEMMSIRFDNKHLFIGVFVKQ